MAKEILLKLKNKKSNWAETEKSYFTSPQNSLIKTGMPELNKKNIFLTYDRDSLKSFLIVKIYAFKKGTAW